MTYLVNVHHFVVSILNFIIRNDVYNIFNDGVESITGFPFEVRLFISQQEGLVRQIKSDKANIRESMQLKVP